MPEDAASRPTRRLGAPALEDDPAGSARRRVLESRQNDSRGVESPGEGPSSVRPPGSEGAANRGSVLLTEPRPSSEPILGPAAPPRVKPVATGWRTSKTVVALERRAPSLSPRMTAVFGALFGLATVTTIVALLIQGSPPRNDRAEAGSAAALGSGAPDDPANSEAAAAAGPKKRVRVKIPGPWRVSELEKDAGVRMVSGTISRESFIGALGEKGVPKDQIYRILKAFEGVRKFDKTNRKDRFVVALDKADKHVRGFEFEVSAFEIFQAKEEQGLLVGSQLDLKIAEETVSGSFYVGKNLARSIEWGGFEPALGKAIDEALSGRSSVDELEEGGTVRVIATEVTALGDFAKYKDVVALEIRGADPAATPLRVYSFDERGARGYFDERGRQPDGGGWSSPVPGAPRTSPFNPKRMHPVLKKVMPHNGTDYGAPTGTPIYSVYRGTVTHAGPAGPCGTMVAISHANKIESGYCHMSKMVPSLKVGQKVGTKQLIGYVGTTGRSTGPHLHFWTKRDGKFFDSETLKIDGFRVVPPDQREAFAKRKAELDVLLDALPLPDPPPPEPSAPAAGSTEPVASAQAPSKGPDDDGDDDETPAKVPSGPIEHGVGEEGEDMVGPDLSKVPKGKP